MSSSADGVIPTRAVDLSGVSLVDLDHCDSAQLGQVCQLLVREVTAAALVSLAGSQS
jgi:hypothetical protein